MRRHSAEKTLQRDNAFGEAKREIARSRAHSVAGRRLGMCAFPGEGCRKRGTRDFSREVGNGKNGDFAQGNALRALDARKFLHADAKRFNRDGAIGHRVANFVRGDKMQTAVLALYAKPPHVATQFRNGIAANRDCRKVPQVGYERRHVIDERFPVFLFGRRKQQRTSLLIGKNCGSQTDLYGCAFLALFWQQVRNALLPALTELRYRTEKTLRGLR